jgi:hypothetical protein
MNRAKDLEKTWFYFSEKVKKDQANHLLTKCKDYICHEVGKLKVFKWKFHCEVVNEESKKIKFFNTEEEAINYCLDVYPETKINEQTTIFDSNGC